MPLYFAYGSCMNAKDLSRTVDAIEICTARLENYRLSFSRYSASRRGGVADVVPCKGSFVEGVLFIVPDFKGLDAREGHPTFYRRKKIYVNVESEGKVISVEAFTYEVVRKEKVEVKPTKEYALLIWDGAKRLSKEYRMILRENLKSKRQRYVPKPVVTPIRTKPVYKTARMPFTDEWDEYTRQYYDAYMYGDA